MIKRGGRLVSSSLFLQNYAGIQFQKVPTFWPWGPREQLWGSFSVHLYCGYNRLCPRCTGPRSRLSMTWAGCRCQCSSTGAMTTGSQPGRMSRLLRPSYPDWLPRLRWEWGWGFYQELDIIKVKPLLLMYQVPFDGWNHLDFMWAKDADTLLYKPIIDFIQNLILF